MSDKIFNVNKNCPVCQTSVKVSRVKSNGYSLIGRDTDFCPHYNGINPFIYQVTICPQCHYAAPSKTFGTEHPTDELARLRTLLPLLRKKDAEIEFEPTWNYAATSFEFLIRTLQICKKPTYKLAPLFLKTAWCYRFIGDTEKELFFLELACKELENNYLSSNIQSEMSEVRQIYLIGELKRRLGRYDEAISWFGKAVSHPQIKTEPEIERLTREQWYAAKEQKAKSSTQEQPGSNLKPDTVVKLLIEINEEQINWLRSFLATAPLPPHQVLPEFIIFLINHFRNKDEKEQLEIYQEFKNTLSHF